MGSSTKSVDTGHLKQLGVFNITEVPNSCGTAVEEKVGKVQAGQNMKSPVHHAKDYKQAIQAKILTFYLKGKFIIGLLLRLLQLYSVKIFWDKKRLEKERPVRGGHWNNFKKRGLSLGSNSKDRNERMDLRNNQRQNEQNVVAK